MKTEQSIYLDYAATTPVDERVLAVMMPYFSDVYGNPSSIHHFGQLADAALEQARAKLAASLNATADEIVFTANGTESDNLALRSTAFLEREKRGATHILTTPLEHPAITRTVNDLAKLHGFMVDILPVDDTGRVLLQDVDSLISQETALVSVIYASNEIGTINPIAEIGAICRRHGIPLHTDAVQAAAHLRMDVEADQVDLLSLGAHKFYGPKGVGALYVRRGLEVLPVQTGGGQEGGRRAGTQNIPYIVGMAEAFQLAQQEADTRADRLEALRDELITAVVEQIPHTRLTGHRNQRLPNHASFAFEGVDGYTLLMMLDVAGFSCSSGSACKAGTPQVSEALTAIGLPREWALGALRVTLGKFTTRQHILALIAALPDIVRRARAMG